MNVNPAADLQPCFGRLAGDSEAIVQQNFVLNE
jgi:hypothetical protein